jgi:hypothetical protein
MEAKQEPQVTHHPSKNAREIKNIEFQIQHIEDHWLVQIEKDHARVGDETVYQANLAAANEKMDEWKDKLKKLQDGAN